MFQHLDNIWLCGVLVGGLEHVLFFHSVGNNPNFHIYHMGFSTTNQSSIIKLTTQVNFVSPSISQLIHFTPFFAPFPSRVGGRRLGAPNANAGRDVFPCAGPWFGRAWDSAPCLAGSSDAGESRADLQTKRRRLVDCFFLNKLFGT